MKSITRDTMQWRNVARLCLALAITFLLTASAPAQDKAAAPEAAPAEKAAEETAPAPSPPAAPAAQTQSGPIGDFVSLYKEQQEYRKSGKSTAAQDQEFDAKWKAMTEGIKPRTLTPGLDFLAVNTKATGEKEYTFSFLFAVTADLQADYHLTVLGYVFPMNSKYLPDEARERKYAKWSRNMKDDPTSKWKSGEYHVVQMKTASDIIPYNLRLSLHTRDEKGAWLADVGEAIALGWQWDVLGEAAFVERINSCKDYASLYALAPSGPGMSEGISKAVSVKWEALTAGLHPQALIEGLDFLDMQLKATGAKEYTFSFLLRSNADITSEYHLSVVGKVDPSFKHYIKPDKPEGAYVTWNLLLYDDPTTQWKAGEFHVAQIKVPTEIIPFDVTLMLQTRSPQKSWTGNPGNRITLGWRADVSE